MAAPVQHHSNPAVPNRTTALPRTPQISIPRIILHHFPIDQYDKRHRSNLVSTMGKLYYFQAPSLNINPESPAAPRLGSIFATCETLMAPLNQYEHLSPPPSLMNKSSYADFEETRSRGLEVSAGINATAAYGIGGSGDIVYAFARNKHSVFACSLLDTIEFEPTREFVTESILASPAVQQYLENAIAIRKRVFMVTGLKIATNLSVSSTRETQHNPKLKINVDATAAGAPVQAGPELDLSVEGAQSVAHGTAMNKIVFAYRVARVKQSSNAQAKFKYKSGGKYGVGGDNDSAGKDLWDIEVLDEESIEKQFSDPVTRVEVEQGEVEDASACGN